MLTAIRCGGAREMTCCRSLRVPVLDALLSFSFIDDDTWPPSLHGTGGEDYFSQGWGMQKNAYPFCGSIIHEDDLPNNQVSYRFHLADPVRFNKRIKVTLESGHANHLRDDWSTTAYWYQTLPGPKLTILPVEHNVYREKRPFPRTMSRTPIPARCRRCSSKWYNREPRGSGSICETVRFGLIAELRILKRKRNEMWSWPRR